MTVTISDASESTQTIAADHTITGPSTTNLVLWLKADAGITYDGSNLVSAWTDSSGGGHDATQSTSSSKPLYVANALNSQPGIRFDGADDFLDVAGGSFAIAQVFIVFKSMTATFSYGSVLGSPDSRPFLFESGQTYFHWSPFPTAVWSNGSALSSPYNLGTITDYKVVTINTYNPSSARSYRIGRSDATFYGNLEVAEIMGYSSDNSSDVRSDVEAYLAYKYGL
jgi:hypothetical protein